VGEDRTDRPSPDLDRLTVAQAADALNISQDAVRKRIARGTIPHDRDGSGRVYVYLSPSETVHKTDQDARVDEASKTVQDRYIRSLEDQIAFLRRELERKDAILLNLSSKIPELEPPESPETVEETSEGAEPRPGTEEAQEGTQRRSWWRRVLGG
jgi:excisionase family DNA binding protein